MQTDWGGECQKLNSFFQRVGISHLVSCPHAHQQNGPAERKHRHIVEVGLSLLAYASMPLKYWDEAFLTAIYLINHLPSKVIQSKTPMERLFGKSGDYSLLRTFGCACRPNLRPYNRHKLDFWSKQCAFLGYNNLHKAYKCLDISTGRLYISRDIVFDETVFPFAALHSNAGAWLHAEIDLFPLSLHPFNLHHHEGHELHVEPVDVNPANATNGVAESFLQNSDHIFASDDESKNNGHFGAETPSRPGAGTQNMPSLGFPASGSSASSGSLPAHSAARDTAASDSDVRDAAAFDSDTWDRDPLSHGDIARRDLVSTSAPVHSGRLSATPASTCGSSTSSSTATGRVTGSHVSTPDISASGSAAKSSSGSLLGSAVALFPMAALPL
jgi:hypothetical protein